MFLEYIKGLLLVVLLGNTSCEVMLPKSCTKKDMNSLVCNYIPYDIDKNISRVYVVDYTNTNTEKITTANFSTQNWRHIKYLEVGDRYKPMQAFFYFQARCFKELTFLKELHLHINKPMLAPDAFVGLNSLTTLDVSGCQRLKYSNMIEALNGSHKMPQLEKVYMSGLTHVYGPFPVDDIFVNILSSRNITHLDLTDNQIPIINVTAIVNKLQHLQVFNLSYSVISEEYAKHLNQSGFRPVKLIDLSWATLPMHSALLPGKIVFRDLHALTSKLHPSVKFFFTPETMNYSAIVRPITSVWLRNVTATIDVNLHWYTRHLILQQNNLKRLDISVNCTLFNMSSFELIDLSKNDLEFLHPSFLHCMPNLKTVYLSHNNLYIMLADNVTLFEQMFFQLPGIKHISLAANSLKFIPGQFFLKNDILETIDLSSNTLKQVSFKLHNLVNLQILDLRNNEIALLDAASINNLNSIQTTNITQNYSTSVLLTSNPISCSKCETETFLKWILATNLTDESSQNLTCTTENNNKQSINKLALKYVHELCIRKTSILVGSIVGSIVFLLIVIIIGIIIKKRHTLRKQNRSNIISELHEGEGEREFVAYLAYSSDDQDFVSQYVLHDLNSELGLMTGIDRELVCTGDVHLRFGFDIHSETIRCIERSSVVIALLSKNFCTSEYCLSELDEAYIRNKPIVLMFKEFVPEELMVPRMKELYRKNVRMLWEFENGSYKLKSTWENACSSILDLVK